MDRGKMVIGRLTGNCSGLPPKLDGRPFLTPVLKLGFLPASAMPMAWAMGRTGKFTYHIHLRQLRASSLWSTATPFLVLILSHLHPASNLHRTLFLGKVAVSSKAGGKLQSDWLYSDQHTYLPEMTSTEGRGEIFFEDIFTVTKKDPDGRKFDRGGCSLSSHVVKFLKCHSATQQAHSQVL
jgi:hypothetical protein